MIDPKSQVYKFTYNALGMVVAQYDLADTTKADTLKYDVVGNVRSVRTRRGDVVTMTYDLVGRLLSRWGPDFPVDSFKYDPTGRWSVAWNVNQRDSSAFDQAGRLVATRQSMLGGVAYQLTYDYDNRDRLWNRSAPIGGNLARYAYNATTGVIDTLCAAAACVVFRRNGELLTDRRTYHPGQSGSWFHERLFAPDHRASADSFSASQAHGTFSTKWTFDSLGRVKDHGWGFSESHHYKYDAAGRLLDWCQQLTVCTNEYSSVGNAYAYDPAGNRIDPPANPVIGSGNRTQAFKGFSLGYDSNGSVVSKTGGGVSYTYTWDALGRLIEVRNNGLLIATYKYDALGRRIAGTAPDGTIERYVYDGAHVILDVNGSHAIKAEYGYEPGVDRLFAIKNTQTAAWTGVVIADPMIGAVRGIANLSGGGVRKEYTPTAWGEIGPDTGVVTRFRMAGREYDQVTKLYYMRARYYDPELGRFLSEDPIGLVGGLNLYVYAGNDPVNRRDPSGLCHDDESGGDSTDPPKPPKPPDEPLIAESAPVPSSSCGGGEPSYCWLLGNCPGDYLHGRGGAEGGTGGGGGGGFAGGTPPAEWAWHTWTETELWGWPLVPLGAGFVRLRALFARLAPWAVRSAPFVAPNANTLHHIFNNPGHKLAPLVRAFGTKDAAFQAVGNAIGRHVTQTGMTGVFRGVIVRVGDFDVVIGGRVIGGVVHIGTFRIR